MWALSLQMLKGDDILARLALKLGLLKGERPIQLVTALCAGNPNLHAQQGLFTLFRSKIDPQDPVERRAVDEILQNTMVFGKTGPKTTRPYKVLLHFTLPANEAGNLLWHLAKEGVTAARLFPGYAGVVKGLDERKLWKD